MNLPTTSDVIRAATQLAQSGKRAQARDLLLQAAERDPASEELWLWLAGVSDSPEEMRAFLETVLALNPENKQAQKGIRWLEKRRAKGPTPPVPAGPRAAESRGANPVPQPTAQVRPSPPPVDMPPGFHLTVRQAEAIDACLENIAYESEARCIILADVTGQLISERGDTQRMNTQVLSALSAGELAATQELARLVGERARFRLLLHEGEEHSVYLSDVGEQLLIIIVFDQSTPIGLVRIILKKAVEDLMPILQARDEDEGALDGDFARLLDDELDSSLKFSS
jgi:predicted regulator of Ras-like GTPase activity (Roadblock/LC7/MglB family)